MHDDVFKVLSDYKMGFARAGCRCPDYITINMLNKLGITIEDLKDLSIRYGVCGFDRILGMEIVSSIPNLTLES